jgi:hypothetical protein
MKKDLVQPPAADSAGIADTKVLSISGPVEKVFFDGAVKVQYLHYPRFLRISCTDKYAAFFGNRASLDLELFPAPSENLLFTKPSFFEKTWFFVQYMLHLIITRCYFLFARILSLIQQKLTGISRVPAAP